MAEGVSGPLVAVVVVGDMGGCCCCLVVVDEDVDPGSGRDGSVIEEGGAALVELVDLLLLAVELVGDGGTKEEELVEVAVVVARAVVGADTFGNPPGFLLACPP